MDYPYDRKLREAGFNEEQPYRRTKTPTENAPENENVPDNVTPINFARLVEPTQFSADIGPNPMGIDQQSSSLETAFLQIMTRKVAKAIANQPELLKNLNSVIKTDNK